MLNFTEPKQTHLNFQDLQLGLITQTINKPIMDMTPDTKEKKNYNLDDLDNLDLEFEKGDVL